MKIKLGKNTETNEKVEVDISTLIDTRLLIQANSGAGKSWTVRRLLEQTHGKVQQIIIDPEGEFASLREKYDYILVGKNGDIPTSIKSAELLAKRLLELNASAIIDLYELKYRDRIRYVKLFIDALVNAPKELWHPCLIIIDEGHIFIPEKGEAESSSAVIDICTRGRKRGFAPVIATQRLSKLNKDAAAELLNKLIGRTSLDIDMKRAGDELGITTKKELFKLRELKPGEFFTFGPAISQIVAKVKIGNVKTIHPKVGSRQLQVIPPAPSKIKRMLEKLEDLPEESEKEIRDKAGLKAEIRRLKLMLREKPKSPKPIADEKAIERARYQGFNEAKKQYEVQIHSLKGSHTKLTMSLIKIAKIIGDQTGTALKIPEQPTIDYIPKYKPETKTKFKIKGIGDEHPVQKDFNKYMKDKEIPNGDIKLRTGARRMLDVMASFNPTEPTKVQLATFAGFAMSGTFSTYLGDLKRAGFVTETNGKLAITDEGIEEAGNFTPISMNRDDFIETWAKKFRTGAAKMLKTINLWYPNPISKEELSIEVGILTTSGTFSTYLGDLRRNKLITVNSSGIILNEEIIELTDS